MPNLNGLFADVPNASIWIAVGMMAALAGVVLIARRGSFAAGLAAATVGSLMVTGHTYLSDVLVLLPGLLAIAQESTATATAKFFTFVWLGPILPLLLLLGHPAPYAPQIVLPSTLLALAISDRQSVPEPQPATVS